MFAAAGRRICTSSDNLHSFCWAQSLGGPAALRSISNLQYLCMMFLLPQFQLSSSDQTDGSQALQPVSSAVSRQVIYAGTLINKYASTPLHSRIDNMDFCRALIQCLRRMSPAHCYATSMSPPAVEQVIAAMHVLRGRDGSDRGIRKIQKLHDNANYFRHRLADMGCSVLGNDDSPVMVSVACLHLHLVVLPSHLDMH